MEISPISIKTGVNLTRIHKYSLLSMDTCNTTGFPSAAHGYEKKSFDFNRIFTGQLTKIFTIKQEFFLQQEIIPVFSAYSLKVIITQKRAASPAALCFILFFPPAPAPQRWCRPCRNTCTFQAYRRI